MNNQDYQPRYLAYCAAHDMAPEQMLNHDKKRWPGGCMCGFIIWISEQWRAWAIARGGMPSYRTDAHHKDFDLFLRGNT